jgi:hypothetical protein
MSRSLLFSYGKAMSVLSGLRLEDVPHSGAVGVLEELFVCTFEAIKGFPKF